MSTNWPQDIRDMHNKFGASEWVSRHSEMEGTRHLFQKLLEFRLNFLDEELLEARKAAAQDNAEEIVDAMIDLCVVAIGTLDLFGVDVQKAWDEVLEANMAKKAGLKPGRPNPLGLPDLMKPPGWKPPSHEGNTGIFYNEF